MRIIEESDYYSDGYKHSCDWLSHLTLLMLIVFTAFFTAFNKKKTQKKSKLWNFKWCVESVRLSDTFLWQQERDLWPCVQVQAIVPSDHH